MLFVALGIAPGGVARAAAGGTHFCEQLLTAPVISAQAEGTRAQAEPDFTLGREYSALAPASVTPLHVLRLIQQERGGEITPHPTTPRKWVLTDSAGKRWGAEYDGKVPGGDNVLEVQTPPLGRDESALMELPLKALLAAGATPMYSVGGGHIHVDLAANFLPHPKRFASLVNFLLNHEELLNLVFSNPQRAHAVRKLSTLFANDGQTVASRYLGGRLNEMLDKNDEAALLHELEDFAMNVVKLRDTDFNLRSWRGSGGKKTHGTLELRFFNAPKTLEEARLELALVRAIALYSIRHGDASPVRYKPLVDALEGENAYLDDARLLADLRAMLAALGLPAAEYERVFLDNLRVRRHPSS